MLTMKAEAKEEGKQGMSMSRFKWLEPRGGVQRGIGLKRQVEGNSGHPKVRLRVLTGLKTAERHDYVMS